MWSESRKMGKGTKNQNLESWVYIIGCHCGKFYKNQLTLGRTLLKSNKKSLMFAGLRICDVYSCRRLEWGGRGESGILQWINNIYPNFTDKSWPATNIFTNDPAQMIRLRLLFQVISKEILFYLSGWSPTILCTWLVPPSVQAFTLATGCKNITDK